MTKFSSHLMKFYQIFRQIDSFDIKRRLELDSSGGQSMTIWSRTTIQFIKEIYFKNFKRLL